MSCLPCCYSSSFSPSLIHELPQIKKFQVFASSNQSNDSNNNSTKLVTFLGKGGSGKTTSSIFAAQHFAMAGLATCLVLHSQDPTAEYLLNCKIGTSPTVCNKNLSAVRLESTKMLLEPLKRLKEADARLNMTQGFLGGIVGEELGVLLGMDSIFSALAVESYLGTLGILAQKDRQKDKFDVIVYDGMSSEEILRMIGTPTKSRLYLKYLRSMAEKTDIGRLAGPSLLRLVDEAINSSRSSSPLNGKLSSEIWDTLEQKLERGSSALAEALGCYLVMDTRDPASMNSALRYWGCAIQAGAHVSGAFAIPSKHQSVQSLEKVKENFLPLPFASIPQLPMDAPPDWNSIVLGETARYARNLLSSPSGRDRSVNPSVNFDMVHKTVTLLMPGFDKSEIKLYQYRGGSELLVEAGDQRRIIYLPPKIQGKVAGAKFIDRNLTITMR